MTYEAIVKKSIDMSHAYFKQCPCTEESIRDYAYRMSFFWKLEIDRLERPVHIGEGLYRYPKTGLDSLMVEELYHSLMHEIDATHPTIKWNAEI